MYVLHLAYDVTCKKCPYAKFATLFIENKIDWLIGFGFGFGMA